MNSSEDEIFEEYAKKHGHCLQNTLPPTEFEFSRISCGYNIIKKKNELSKIQRKRIIFVKRLKIAEHKMFCICLQVHKLYDRDDYDKKTIKK